MKTEMIPWVFIQDATVRVINDEVERLDYTSKSVTVKVYRAGTVIRIDIKEVSNG